MCDAVYHTGATDSIVVSSKVSDPNRRGYCAVKVGDEHYTYSEGEKSVDVCMGHFNLPHVCIVMETSAFQVCLGMNFIRQNAKTILSSIFTPSRLIVKNPETDELSLVSLSEKCCQKEGGNVLPPAQYSLRISRREAYSLLPSLREQVLIGLGAFRPTVDLYTNPKSHTEPLYCTLLNSCYAYNWHDFQLCWANPSWSHLEKMVTKAVLHRAQVVVICPDWGQTGEAAAWRPFLDRMTKVRVPIPDVPHYLPDGATSPLPAPRWGTIASVINGNDCNISLDELNPQVVKFLHRVNRALTRSDLLKRYGHDTPATTPKGESEVPEIHPPTESDEEQDAGVRDAEVDKVDIQWEEISEEPAEVQWDEVSEDGYLADLNMAQPLKYDPFPSIQDYSDRIEDLLNEVDLEDSVMGGVQNFTMSCLALHAMQEYGVTMQVEEDKARIANARGWPVPKDNLCSLREDIELRIFQISEEQQRLELKDRWKSYYNEFLSRSVDGDETDLFYQYLDDDRFIVHGNDVYLDVSALLRECYSVSRNEYGKSNLAAADDFEEKIKNLPSRIQKVLLRRKVAFGPLMAHGSCEKLVTMDLELMDEHKNNTVHSKPFTARKSDSEEIMRQITECIAANLAEEYEQAEYPKHCSPCFLVDTPGSYTKRLVVHYGKLNKLTKKHSGSLPKLEQALERAVHCRFKSKLDKRSGFWQVELTKQAQDLSAFFAPNGQVFKWKVTPFGLRMLRQLSRSS